MQRTVGIWLDGDQEFDDLAFMFFVLSMSRCQNSIACCFPDPQDEDFSFTVANDRQDKGEEIYEEEEFDFHIFITKEPIEGNLFYTVQGKVALITTATWENDFSPPSIFEYLVHGILTATLYCVSDHQLDQHDDTWGCQFEYNRIKDHDRIDIALGYICDSHKNQIRRIFGEEFLRDYLLLISFDWAGKADDVNSTRYKLKHYFRYDLDKDSGFKKNFFERSSERFDAIPLEFAKEVLKGLIFIFTAYLLVRFGLKP